MKKVLLLIAVVAGLYLLINVETQAQITSVPPIAQPRPASAPIPMGARVLPKTDAQKKEFVAWQQLYGFDKFPHIYYNLAVMLNIADQQGRLINRNRDYIRIILEGDDPNSLVSVVVADHNSIDALVKENVELKKRITKLEKQVNVQANLLKDIEALWEESLKSLPSWME